MMCRMVVAASLAIGAATACLPTAVCGCSPPDYQVSVVGFTLSADGSAAEAQLDVEVRDSECAVAAIASAAYSATDFATEPNGRFEFYVYSSAADRLCLRIVARRLTSADSTVRDSVYVTPGRGDTVRVDLTFP